MCPGCRQPLAACVCRAAAAVPPAHSLGKVWRETQGRGGKTVTLVAGLPLDASALAALAKQLKSACGSGGAVKNGAIEVQGDHVERVMQALARLGHRAKRVGG